jgi:hypothetical protein
VRRRSSGVRTSQRRRREWADYTSLSTIGATTNALTNVLGSFESVRLALADGCTVERIVGETWIAPLNTGLTALLDYTFGVGVFDRQTPAFDLSLGNGPYMNWMLYRRLAVPPIAAGLTWQTPLPRWNWDIRSKRKVDELGNSLLQFDTNKSTVQIQVFHHWRVLLALP